MRNAAGKEWHHTSRGTGKGGRALQGLRDRRVNDCPCARWGLTYQLLRER